MGYIAVAILRLVLENDLVNSSSADGRKERFRRGLSLFAILTDTLYIVMSVGICCTFGLAADRAGLGGGAGGVVPGMFAGGKLDVQLIEVVIASKQEQVFITLRQVDSASGIIDLEFFIHIPIGNDTTDSTLEIHGLCARRNGQNKPGHAELECADFRTVALWFKSGAIYRYGKGELNNRIVDGHVAGSGDSIGGRCNVAFTRSHRLDVANTIVYKNIGNFCVGGGPLCRSGRNNRCSQFSTTGKRGQTQFRLAQSHTSFGFCTLLHRHLGISGAGDDARFSRHHIRFCSVAAVYPQIIGPGFGKGDFCLTLAVGRLVIGVICIKGFAIVQRITGFCIQQGRTAHTGTAGTAQGDSQRFACGGGIFMGDLLIIKEIVEARSGVTEKIPTGEARHIDEIAGLDHDLIGGRAPAFTGKRIYTIHIIVQIFVKSKDTAGKIGAARCSCKGNIAPFATIQVLMGIDRQMQRGDFIDAITVRIILILSQAVFGQINGQQVIHVHRNIRHGAAVFTVNVLLVMADGDIHRSVISVIACQHGGGQHGEHHGKGQEQTQQSFLHLFLLLNQMIFNIYLNRVSRNVFIPGRFLPTVGVDIPVARRLHPFGQRQPGKLQGQRPGDEPFGDVGSAFYLSLYRTVAQPFGALPEIGQKLLVGVAFMRLAPQPVPLSPGFFLQLCLFLSRLNGLRAGLLLGLALLPEQLQLPLVFLFIDRAAFYGRQFSRFWQTAQGDHPLPVSKPLINVRPADQIPRIGGIPQFCGLAPHVIQQLFFRIILMYPLKGLLFFPQRRFYPLIYLLLQP